MGKMMVVILLLLGLAAIAAADMYKLENVRRLDANAYKADGGLIIKTRCYHYAHGKNPIYDDRDRKIIWKEGDSRCEVDGTCM